MTTPTQKLRGLSRKPIIITIIGLFVLILVLGGIKAMQFGTMMASGQNFTPPPESVTTATAQLSTWETSLSAVGSLTAVEGIMLSAEQAGKVVEIAFEPGSKINAGDLVLQQDISTEKAQLRAAQASAELAKINLKRSKDLLSKRLTSQSDYDAASARHKEAIAQADSIHSQIEKKTIRAPFTGNIGTKRVYLGQQLREGEEIASLQALDRLTVDFMLPQQYLPQVKAGLVVRVSTDAAPGKKIEGVIEAVDSVVDANTRNFAVQASIPNPEEKLLPGLFVAVEVILPQTEPILSIPATSVVHASYGASVFVVDKKEAEDGAEPQLLARQQFVKLGRTQGDFVAVLSGLNENDTVVSTGAFKLFNGQTIAEKNDMAPEFELDPKPADS